MNKTQDDFLTILNNLQQSAVKRGVPNSQSFVVATYELRDQYAKSEIPLSALQAMSVFLATAKR